MRETKEVPKTSTWKTIVRVACDLCGREAVRPNEDERLWTKDSYDVDKVTIERTTGARYPEGGQHTTTSYDVCPECWKTKIVPLFEAAGAKPEESEIDF